MIKSFKAFTLVEFLVVIAIISILTFFAVPALFSSREDSKEAARSGTLWTINVGLARAYKDKDPQLLIGGVLSQVPTAWDGNTNAAENALAYLIERGYVR